MKVLILKPSSLGDIIHALPVLRLIKRQRPDWQVHWWIAEPFAPLLERDTDITALHPFRHRGWGTPAGLAFAKMPQPQQRQLERLIVQVVRTLRGELADEALQGIRDAGLERVHFAWAGGLAPGVGHYYRVQGPTFIIEYDNTQNDANHIHAVWRNPSNDFGEDVLSRHYAQSH